MRVGGRIGGGLGPFGGAVGGSVGRGGASFGVGGSAGPFHAGVGGHLPKGRRSSGSSSGCGTLILAALVVGLVVLAIAFVGPLVFGAGLAIVAFLLPMSVGDEERSAPRLAVTGLACALGLLVSVGVGLAMAGPNVTGDCQDSSIEVVSSPATTLPYGGGALPTTPRTQPPATTPPGQDCPHRSPYSFLRSWVIGVSIAMVVLATIGFLAGLGVRLALGRSIFDDSDKTPQPTQPSYEHVVAAMPQWAPDPWGQARLRYWDGERWTQDVSA